MNFISSKNGNNFSLQKKESLILFQGHMIKQLSRKSHRPCQQSIDDFMKNIRRYNMKSERYLSPKPLLYMYTNTKHSNTHHTLDRSKSRTLSNRKHSNSKKTSHLTREKVQKMLSVVNTSKKSKHKKSMSSLQLNKSHHKHLSRYSGSGGSILVEDFTINDRGQIKKKRSKGKEGNKGKTSRLPTVEELKKKQTIATENQQADKHFDNPGDLIENYSKKIQKVQKYLESKSKMGQLMCRKFQEMLNHIIESFVSNLKSSLDTLEVNIQKRLAKSFQIEFNKCQNQSKKQIKQLTRRSQKCGRKCQRLEKKCLELMQKENFSNALIYNLRVKGIDIDKEFGQAVFGIDNLGGFGYNKSSQQSSNSRQNSRQFENQPGDRQKQFDLGKLKAYEKHIRNVQSQQDLKQTKENGQKSNRNQQKTMITDQKLTDPDLNLQMFKFQQHPNKKRKKYQPQDPLSRSKYLEENFDEDSNNYEADLYQNIHSPSNQQNFQRHLPRSPDQYIVEIQETDQEGQSDEENQTLEIANQRASV